jgi:hypothetical protein
LISRGASQPLGVPNSVPPASSFPLQSSSSAPPETLISALQVSQTEPVKKFEPKSKLWSDTLSRGLVNLDISGRKLLFSCVLFFCDANSLPLCCLTSLHVFYSKSEPSC